MIPFCHSASCSELNETVQHVFRAWIPDSEDDLVARLSRKVGILSNLEIDTAEEFQVRFYVHAVRFTRTIIFVFQRVP